MIILRVVSNGFRNLALPINFPICKTIDYFRLNDCLLCLSSKEEFMPQIAAAGRQGNDVRSDCWIKLELREAGGIEINLSSKVKLMYGKSIEKLMRDELAFFGINNARVEIEDQGALPFVLMARLETAVKRCLPDLKPEYVPAIRECCHYPTHRERFRRSRLYLPGTEPKFIINAGLHQPDGIILDLEDSVPPAEKDAAAILVRNALCQVDFYGAERMVRINQLPRGLADLPFIVPYNVHVILIPKCESADQVKQVEAATEKLLEQASIHHPVYFMPIVESALGAVKAFEMATASKNNIALTIGLEDYTADLGTQRTPEGRESFWARQQVVNAARAAGIQPIDTVFSDVTDMEGLRQSVLEAKSLGFDGKGCIHPRQVRVINEAFVPEADALERAQKIVLAFDDAQAKGLGVIALGSKMIDLPVVKRALRTVELAILSGILEPDWREGGAENAE
jgi:citrate lyase subunit beta/citryl-CoA lyase